jgi:hypothetical protein
MKKQAFFLVAITTACIAFGFHVASRELSVKSTFIRSQMWDRSVVEKQEMRMNANHLESVSKLLLYSGLPFTCSAVVCLVIAYKRKEPGLYSIPIMVLGCDFAVQLLL